MTTAEYLSSVNKRFASGITTEHSFRGDLAQLIESLLPEIIATNEPKHIDCGAPDYVLTRNDIPVGFIEAKDIGDKDLEGKKKSGHKEQFDRYKASLDNLIFTDYLRFYLYRNGELVTQISLAEIDGNRLVPQPENFEAFENLIKDFPKHVSQTIKSPKKLAKMMAGKARLLYDVIFKALTSDEEHQEDSTLKDQMQAFREILIHDITPKSFAGVYAQTIAYGMFAARLHDPTLPTFSRQEAAELIPKSNPFLRKLFGYIAGPDIDDRIKWIVDSLIEVFLACNVEEILHDYGKATRKENPIIHFYETFLSEYDPKLRKARGVWYTPAPVVNFIVRGVDEILKTEFDLPQGLADTSKTTMKVRTDVKDKRAKSGYKMAEQEVHKVQLLDPASGTGTFLAEVIKHIHQKFKGQEGIWSSYVEQHLIPRLNGFELLMASYAMAHLQLDLLLKDTGFHPTKTQRLNVYLTNSLEEAATEHPNLFMARWLTEEALQADRVKRDKPVMCVLGNPPYSGESANKGKWIMDLMTDYKKEPGGKTKLKERNPKWINDDYVKFIRYGQHYIEKNGSGVLAFINPHGFLDNPTFRGMRWHLLKTFDKIYTLDLHGNSKKKETTPDGGKDENVFDIMQGVSINFFIKTGKKGNNEFGQVFHADLFGKRNLKYETLTQNSLASLNWETLDYRPPNYFFVPKDYEAQEAFLEGFKVNELFSVNSVGIVTSRDSFVIDDTKIKLEKRIKDFFDLDRDALLKQYKIRENKRWKIDEVKNNAIAYNPECLKNISYRPFDNRFVYYNENFIERSRGDVMQHFLKGNNVGLSLCKQFKSGNTYQHTLMTNRIIESSFVSNKTSEITSTFPLYLYPEKSDQQKLKDEDSLKPNLNPELVKGVEKKLGLKLKFDANALFASAAGSTAYFYPVDLLDYIYAVLHAPAYREKYKEFLKIDFPRVPYPEDQAKFWQLVKLGGALRKIHLLESPVVEDYSTTYPKPGNNEITRKITKRSPGFVPDKENPETGKVWINDEQYFEGVPKTAWEFYIGGYQPAQKWLKDRKGRTLSFEDILHYQKIIVALTETDRLMGEIDKVGVVEEEKNEVL